MSESQLSAVSEYAPPDCAVCQRSLLVGEALRLYRDASERLVKVCELCRDRALEHGWERLGPVGQPRLRVQPSGSVADMVDREGLIEGLGHELAYLKQQLGAAQSALSTHSLQEEAVRAINDKLRRQERELERLRRETDPVARAEEQRTILKQTAQLKEARKQLRERDLLVSRLQHARQDESNQRAMCRHAVDVFNSSEHADRMARIARTLGEPDVMVIDQGPAIPRRIHIMLVWDIAWYEFFVKLDLGAGRASVHELGSGGDARTIPGGAPASNARWRDSGIILA